MSEVILRRNVFNKIMHMIDKAKKDEVSGFGMCTYEDGAFTVNEAIMIKQEEQTSASTTMDAQAAANAMFELKDYGDYLWWWHTHPNMGVFWSSTDTTAINELSEHGVVVATVFNEKQEMKSAVQQGKPFGVADLDIPTFIENEYIDEATLKAWDKEYEDNKAIPKPLVPNTPARWDEWYDDEDYYYSNYGMYGGKNYIGGAGGTVTEIKKKEKAKDSTIKEILEQLGFDKKIKPNKAQQKEIRRLAPAWAALLESERTDALCNIWNNTDWDTRIGGVY